MEAVFQSLIIGMVGIVLLIILDLITRLCSTLVPEKSGIKFSWDKFLLFMRTGVAPFFGIWLGWSLMNILVMYASDKWIPITIPGFAENITAAVIYAAATAIAIKVGNSIWKNLKDSFGISPPKVE